jgi:hypothetical protein
MKNEFNNKFNIGDEVIYDNNKYIITGIEFHMYLLEPSYTIMAKDIRLKPYVRCFENELKPYKKEKTYNITFANATIYDIVCGLLETIKKDIKERK